MKQFLQNTELLEALNQRYAVKQFEKRDTDTAELEKTVKDILTLTPTSFGLQAYKFIIVKNHETREKLKAVSWNQGQVTDADLFVVLSVPTNFDKSFIEKHLNHMKEIRNMEQEKVDGIADFMNNAIITTGPSIGITNFEEWLTRQAYIALGNLMTSLAVLGIDACPLEGIDPKKYNEILNLDEKNLTTKVAIAIGKRSSEDKYQHAEKVRFEEKDIFMEV